MKHIMGRIPNHELPRPITIIDKDPAGAKYIVPVALEAYQDGYESMVQDEYEPVYTRRKGRLAERTWEFSRRVRVFTKPLHYDQNGIPYHCDACEAYWAIEPDKKPEVIMEKDNG